MCIRDSLEADYVPDDVDGVSAGEAILFPLAITPTGCDIATIVDWFLEADGLKFRGTFNVNLER